MTDFDKQMTAALGVAKPEPLYRKGWVVMGSNSEYDDECYYFTEGGFIESPVFFDLKEASRRVDALNKEWRANADPDEWHNSIDDYTPHYYEAVQVPV